MKDRRLYGWPAPVNFGMYATLGIFLVAAFLSLQLTLAVLSLVWGPPPGPPVVSERWTRPLAPVHCTFSYACARTQ